jgi:hypothetical protein
MTDLLDMQNTLTEDEENETDTFGHTKPRDVHDHDHDHAQVQAQSEVPSLADEEIANMQRPKRIRRKPTLLSFDFNSQDSYWTESKKYKLALMKAYTVEVTEPNNPKLVKEKRLHCTSHHQQISSKCSGPQGPQEKDGWIKALKKELKTIIDRGTLNNK